MNRRTRVQLALFGWLVASAASVLHAAEPAVCVVRKGLYDSWLSLSKRAPHTLPRVGALVGVSKSAPEPASALEIHTEYQSLLQCLSDLPAPAGEETAPICKDPAGDRIGALVCQLTQYIKTNRTAGKELL